MRCEDCLDDLPSTHFVIHDENDPDDEDDKRVCADCSGWYANAMEVIE